MAGERDDVNSNLPTHQAGNGDGSSEPSYYDVSILKRPLWRWEIAWYFFLGGLSSGAYTLARVAEWAGGRGGQFAELTKWGTTVGWLALLPCPPLLIADLGDPKRFHHMLRVFKPGSPMSVGTWTLMAYSGAATAAVMREWLGDPSRTPEERSTGEKLLNGTLLLVTDAAGVPAALMVGTYPGVLLSCTANPLWCKNPWLAPLFAAAAFGHGAAATSLALDVVSDDPDSPAHRALDKVHLATHLAGAVTLAGFLRHAGPKAATLTRGKQKGHLIFGMGALAASEVLKRLPLPARGRRLARIASSAVALAGGLSLKWAIVHGGHEAADDPHTARLASKPAPGARQLPGGTAREPNRLAPGGPDVR